MIVVIVMDLLYIGLMEDLEEAEEIVTEHYRIVLRDARMQLSDVKFTKCFG